LSPFCSVAEVIIKFGQKRVGFGFNFYMIPDWNIPNPVQSVIFRTIFGNSLIGKMIVAEVSMIDPPAVLLPFWY
jgi:hypothetical protein